LGKSKLNKIIVKSLKIVKLSKGNVMHILKKDELKNWTFGEAYISKIKFGKIKAWKCHSKMTLNLVVPQGKVKFVFYSPNENRFKVITIGEKNYSRITVPPKIWFGFKGLGRSESIIIDMTNLRWNSKEQMNLKMNKIKFNW
jgi:dTDP-4-dehydrorhamnose 3,5-epimerase